MYFSDVGGFIQGSSGVVSIFVLLGVLLLCTACFNYINLTTAKVTQRAKEVGLKKIIGAKRRTLFAQLIAESFIISLISAMIAIFLISMLKPQFQLLVGDIPVSFVSPLIWIITGIALLFTTILNGIYPGLMLSWFRPVSFLQGKSFPQIKAGKLRRTLVVFQFSLSAALIICVIVIFKQTQYMQNTDPGFQKDHIIRIELPFRTLQASGPQNALLSMQTIKGKLQSNTDVVGISLCNQPIENNRTNINASADWAGRAEDFNPVHSILKVDVEFMNVFGLQLTEGRWFIEGEGDLQNVILNETAIREFKIQEPFIGQRFDYLRMKGNIIGVVKDFHFRSRHEKITPPIIYQQDPFNSLLAIKTRAGKSAEVARELKAIWSEFFPNDAFEYTFVDDAFNNLYRSDIRTSRLLLIFSILAIVIAVLGLYGLSTFTIERRSKEIGIRKVLGASVPVIMRLLTREFLILVAIAFVIAAPVSWWAMSRWLENFAYRIKITVWMYIAGAAITLIIALIATGLQAIKAATENPVEAIKSE
jgi:ABC-type lipoprotein release transport system permease subunit